MARDQFAHQFSWLTGMSSYVIIHTEDDGDLDHLMGDSRNNRYPRRQHRRGSRLANLGTSYCVTWEFEIAMLYVIYSV